MSKDTKHKHILIIGRIPDKENTFCTFSYLTTDEAVAMFESVMIDEYIEENDLDAEGKQEAKDEGVYIDCIITSATALNIDWRC